MLGTFVEYRLSSDDGTAPRYVGEVRAALVLREGEGESAELCVFLLEHDANGTEFLRGTFPRDEAAHEVGTWKAIAAAPVAEAVPVADHVI